MNFPDNGLAPSRSISREFSAMDWDTLRNAKNSQNDAHKVGFSRVLFYANLFSI